jgi:hypothetical protein
VPIASGVGSSVSNRTLINEFVPGAGFPRLIE